MDKEIINIISKITKIPGEELIKHKSSDNLWDSINHVELIFELEERYGVEYTHKEIDEMRTVEKIVKITQRKVQ